MSILGVKQVARSLILSSYRYLIALFAIGLLFFGALENHRATTYEPLRELDFARDGRNFTDESARGLSRFRLSAINLKGTGITDATVRELAIIGTEITALNLSYTAVTDSGMEQLFQLGKLTSLFLDGTSISDESGAHLLRLIHLRTLSLEDTCLTNRFFELLCPSSNIVELSLSRTEADDITVAKVRWLRGLKLLMLSRTRITDAAIASLPSKLEILYVDDTNLTDGCVAELSYLKNLRLLSIRNTRLTAIGRERLRSSLPWSTSIVF